MKLGSVSIKAVQWNYFLLIYPSLLGVVLLNNISASSGASEKMSNLTDPVELAPGTFITGENREFYEQFLGIPFAKPPLGALRFRVRKYLGEFLLRISLKSKWLRVSTESRTVSSVDGEPFCFNCRAELLAVRNPTGHSAEWQ